MAERLNPDQYAEYDAFVKDAKGGTIFHTSWYLLAMADELEVYVLRDSEGRIEAGLALTPVRFLCAKAARRPSWTCYSGPIIRPSGRENPLLKVSEERKLMLKAIALAPRLGMYDYSIPPEWQDMMPFLWNGFDTTVRYIYQIPVAPVEEWQKASSRELRRELRVAKAEMEEHHCLIDVDGDPNEFFDLASGTASRKGFKFRCSREQFIRWWQIMRQYDAASMYVYRDADGVAMEGLIAVRDWRCSYSTIPGTRGSKREGLGLYAQRLLFERLILDAHQRNLTFDFAGSVLPGVEPHLRSWGGRCVAAYRCVKIPNPITYGAWSIHSYLMDHRSRTWFGTGG